LFKKCDRIVDHRQPPGIIPSGGKMDTSSDITVFRVTVNTDCHGTYEERESAWLPGVTVFTTIAAAKEYANAVTKISQSYETQVEKLVVFASGTDAATRYFDTVKESALATLTPAQRYVIEKRL
jgi:hypothetical protein